MPLLLLTESAEWPARLRQQLAALGDAQGLITAPSWAAASSLFEEGASALLFCTPDCQPQAGSCGLPTVLLLDSILQQSVTQRASDIHIEPYESTCVVRFRIDGILYDVQTLIPEQHIPLLSRVKILANIDIAEHRLPQDGRFTIQLMGKRWDVRVSTVPTQFGEKAVLRILPKGFHRNRMAFHGSEIEPILPVATPGWYRAGGNRRSAFPVLCSKLTACGAELAGVDAG